ncbi:MAG TPA: DUF6766 family protein [Actinomycetes bacterium]|jgi:hypothetical protein
MRTWLRDHGLLLANAALFAFSFVGMALAGGRAYNADQTEHGERTVSLGAYLGSGHFIEATFENWESEFLQMGMYVVLTAFLFQRGSSESKPIEGHAPQDDDPRDADLRRSDIPWPVRRGGLVLRIYEHSLALLFLILFLASFLLHLTGGATAYSEEQQAHGAAPVTAWEFLRTSQFWFESFQNWQSEFLAVAVIVGASVYLRQRGSAESKPVAEPHHTTGA